METFIVNTSVLKNEKTKKTVRTSDMDLVEEQFRTNKAIQYK